MTREEYETRAVDLATSRARHGTIGLSWFDYCEALADELAVLVRRIPGWRRGRTRAYGT